MASILESDDNYGPAEFGYAPQGIFRSWTGVSAPFGGYKIHLSCIPAEAQEIAQFVLSILRSMMAKHKVVKNLSEYKRQLNGMQRGKFITIYTKDHVQAQHVLINIDKKLVGHRSGPVPMARDKNGNHTIPEIRVGVSGLLYTRWVNDFTL